MLSEVELIEIEKRLNDSQNGAWKAFIEGRDHTSGSNFIMAGEKGYRVLSFANYDTKLHQCWEFP